jgi:hypothetical protein
MSHIRHQMTTIFLENLYRGTVMTAVILLLALSALIGFVLGTGFSWFAIAASSIGIAFLSSAILQIQGFSWLPGIAVVVACLTVNQMAFLAGTIYRADGPFDDQADREPSQGRDDEFVSKNQQKQRSPSQLA